MTSETKGIKCYECGVKKYITYIDEDHYEGALNLFGWLLYDDGRILCRECNLSTWIGPGR